jgi:inosine/xanthosine triphosphate pyrophosphatase family protein
MFLFRNIGIKLMSYAIYDPATNFIETVFGRWQGRVATEPRGTKSFGYAPIFLSKDSDFKKTNAEFDPEELTNMNHRGKAFLKAIAILNEYFDLK